MSSYDEALPENEEELSEAERQVTFARELAEKICVYTKVSISTTDILTAMKHSIFKLELNESMAVIHASNILALNPEGWYQEQGGIKFKHEQWNLTLRDPRDLRDSEDDV